MVNIVSTLDNIPYGLLPEIPANIPPTFLRSFLPKEEE
jgi:hypothetical protein